MLIDLDANASYTPSASLLEEVMSVLKDLHKYGNPSSIHKGGQRSRAAIEDAREWVRRLVGADKKDLIVFTSGASEANNTVISSKALPGAHLVSSQIEHPCVLAPLKRAEVGGAQIDLVAPNVFGEVAVEEVLTKVRAETALVSIMAANNETGVVNDISQIAKSIASYAPKALVHSDAAQIIGKLPICFSDLGVDCLTLSGHKIGAFAGVGALVIRKEAGLAPLIVGGPQEAKMRGGTENLLGIISFGIAAAEIVKQGESRIDSMTKVRDLFESEILSLIPGCEINGCATKRLPNTVSLWIPGVRADDLVVALDLEGILVSSGAACSSGKPEPSHVLLAMGQDDERVRATIRVSFRADHTPEVVGMVAKEVAKASLRQRERICE